jgi:hypothetical protein
MGISATPPGLLPVQSKRLANRRERTGIDRDSKMNLWHQPLRAASPTSWDATSSERRRIFRGVILVAASPLGVDARAERQESRDLITRSAARSMG